VSVWRSVPICDSCWQEQEPGREPVRVAYDHHRERETCYACGETTYAGIYVRREVEEA
jgi:hypothetical protein